MEDERKKQEEILKVIGRAIRYGSKVCACDRDFSILDVDDGYAQMVGIESEERDVLIGTTMRDGIYPGDVARVAQEVSGFAERKMEYDCKYRLKVWDGSYIWVRDIGKMIEQDGECRIQSTIIDIDEKEKLIRKSKVSYENVPGGVLFLVIGKDNFFIRDANERYFEMVGESRDSYLGSSGKYTFPEDLPKLREHFVTQGEKKEPIDFEFRTKMGKGNVVAWHRLVGSYYDTSEEGVEYLCILHDITKQKNAQFELMRERENYRMGMKNTADLMYEYVVPTGEIRLFGQDYMLDEAKLCIQNEVIMPYPELLFRSNLIYKGDRRKLISFMRNDNQRYDNIRMLTVNTTTGKKYYDYYEFYAYKMYEGECVARVVGYVKKLSYRTVPVSVRQELHQIFDENIIKEYSFVLKIDVPTESFVPYFVEDYSVREYRGNRYYESFLNWWCRTLVAPEDQKDVQYFLSLDQMLRILHSGELKGYRFCQMRGKDSKYRYMICRFSFLASDVNTIILTVRDVHEIRAEEQYRDKLNLKMLTDALAGTKQAVDDRKAFMKYVVKEIAPPVQAMKELLSNGECTETERDVRQYVNYISELVKGMEEYNRLEASHRRSDSRSNLRQLCAEICEEERKLSLGLDISIREEISLPENRLYYVQEFRFREILINLLGNAVRYAPQGTQIHVSVCELRQENDVCVIGIVLEDQGPLIHERFQERLTAEFEEQDWKERISAMGGTGCSLSLAGKITEILGGTIRFRQGVIYNSIVEIELPVYLSSVNEEMLRMTEEVDDFESSECLKGEGILLIENTSREESLTASLLRVNGANVYVAETGEEALEMMKQFQMGIISLILTDRELRDMSCYEFVRRLRRELDLEMLWIPIVEMLEGIQTEDTRLGLTCGINAILHKPLNVMRLVTLLEGFRMTL